MNEKINNNNLSDDDIDLFVSSEPKDRDLENINDNDNTNLIKNGDDADSGEKVTDSYNDDDYDEFNNNNLSDDDKHRDEQEDEEEEDEKEDNDNHNSSVVSSSASLADDFEFDFSALSDTESGNISMVSSSPVSTTSTTTNNKSNSKSRAKKSTKASTAKKAATTKPKKPSKAANKPKRIVPSFKIVKGTNFIVDGFKYKSEDYKHYFLTHFHSDHYDGITKTWNFGPIYCSVETGRLLHVKKQINSEYIKPLPWNKFLKIENVGVAILDANHCPGAAMFLFCIDGEYTLHTGDFRYNNKMIDYPLLRDIKLTRIYLDNTFLDPQFVFPPQQQIVKDVADIVSKYNDGKTLFLFGTYVIGKEKILLEVARQQKQRIFVSKEKYETLSCLDMDVERYFTLDESETCFRATMMGHIRLDHMNETVLKSNGRFKKAIGFVPTGWTKSNKSVRNWASSTIYSVTYSEHSSFSELYQCIDQFRPNEIILTVDCDNEYKVKKYLSLFDEIYERKKQVTLFSFFSRSDSTSTTTSNGGSSQKSSRMSSWFGTGSKTNQHEQVESKSNYVKTIKDFETDDIFDCDSDIDNSSLKTEEEESKKNHLEIKDEKVTNSFTDNNNNNINSSNDDTEEYIDIHDPRVISQQRWIEQQIKFSLASSSSSLSSSSSSYSSTSKNNSTTNNSSIISTDNTNKKNKTSPTTKQTSKQQQQTKKQKSNSSSMSSANIDKINSNNNSSNNNNNIGDKPLTQSSMLNFLSNITNNFFSKK